MGQTGRAARHSAARVNHPYRGSGHSQIDSLIANEGSWRIGRGLAHHAVDVSASSISCSSRPWASGASSWRGAQPTAWLPRVADQAAQIRTS